MPDLTAPLKLGVQLVEVGELDPDHIHTPGIFVKRIYQGERFEKRIERRTVANGGAK